jgi:prepilin-type N-terminal cleavage/methylation domain-containing protein
MAPIRIRDERGLTLVELLMTMALLTVGLSALLSLLNTTDQVQSKDYERGVALSDAQAGLGRMVRDLRAGSAPTSAGIPTAASNVVDLHVPANTDHGIGRMKYDCTLASPSDPTNSSVHACYRYFTNTFDVSGNPVWGTGRLVIDHVKNDEGACTAVTPATCIFTPNSPAPVTFIGVSVVVPTNGTRINGYKYLATFKDGVYLRNAS